MKRLCNHFLQTLQENWQSCISAPYPPKGFQISVPANLQQLGWDKSTSTTQRALLLLLPAEIALYMFRRVDRSALLPKTYSL